MNYSLNKYRCIDCGNKICSRTFLYGGKRCKSCANSNRKISSRKGQYSRKLRGQCPHKLNCACPFCKAKRGELKGENSFNYGIKASKETKMKMSISRKGNTYARKYTELEAISKNTIDNWRKWTKFRKEILNRDAHQCQLCGKKAIAIHHKKPKKEYPELCWVKNNVISVCRKCHNILDKTGKHYAKMANK